MSVLGKTKKEVLLEFRTTEILEAARSVFARRGFASATVEDIADAAGVAKGTVYVYFPSKRDLFLATLRDGVQQLHADAEKRIQAAGSAVAKIRAFIQTRFDYCDRNRDFFRIYYNEFAALPVRSSSDRPEFQDLYDQHARLLEEILSFGIARGEIRPCHVPRTARMIYDLTRSAIAQHVLDDEASPGGASESTADPICDMVCRGIAC